MAVPNIIVSLSGTSFPIPQVGSTPWGQNVTNWIVAASGANGFVQIGGGSQPLLADLNFGANFGLISIYFKSRSANIAGSGVLRLANADIIAFRNHGNTFDDSLGVDANDNLSWSNNATGTPVVTILTGNPAAMYSASAAVAWTVALNTVTGFNTQVYDTDAAFNTGTGIFTVPTGKGGLYFVSASLIAAAGLATSDIVLVLVPSVGQSVASQSNMNATNGQSINATGIFNLAAGATVKVQQQATAVNAGAANASANFVIIKRIS